MMLVEMKSNHVAVSADDPSFTFVDGPCIVQRAGFKIDSRCPDRYIAMLQQAIQNKWIEPVAYLKYEEYCWDKLSHSKDQK